MNLSDQTEIILGNRYVLRRKIGQGGMASVFEAYDTNLERTVAAKLLDHSLSKDEGFRKRFTQEAKSAANLFHPGIVTVYDFGEDPAGIFIIMEFVSGKDLKTCIKEDGCFQIQEGLKLMVQACNALGYAHRAGIVHCDIKSQNIIISDDKQLKITDFGISRVLSSYDKSDERTDLVWGSPQYLSPEQSLGFTPSPSSDVYSLGIVMYEMFTGKLPFISDSAEELIKLHQDQDPKHPQDLIPECPIELDEVIMKVLSKDPIQRYRTADQLGSVLRTIFEDLYKKKQEEIIRPSIINNSEIFPPPLITYEDFSPQTTNYRNAIDWKIIGLELLSIFLVGGLIPFWLYIWFTLKSLIR